MLGAKESLAIAIIIFYVPVIPLAAFLLFRRGEKSRLPWYFLYIFCLVRLTTAILEIIWQNNQTATGVLVGVIVLLRVGILPLLMSTIGIFVVVRRDSFPDLKHHKAFIVFLRLLFVVAAGLVIAGGDLAGQVNDPSDISLGQELTRAGYSIVAAELVFMLTYELYLITVGRRVLNLSAEAVKFVVSTLAVWPFLVLRTIYAFLSTVDGSSVSSMWNAETGSLAALIAMALVPEYCAVGIYVAAGFLIPKRVQHKSGRDGETRSNVSLVRQTV